MNMMASHVEDIVDIRQVLIHLETARHAYKRHIDALDVVIEAGGNDLISAEGANNFRQIHADNMHEVEEMITRMYEWYYQEEE